MNKKVYIILLNYNGWKDTIECLESILKSDYNNHQIIVVDNDSPNKSMDYILNWAEGKQEVVYDENSQLKYLSQPFEQKPLDYVFYKKEEALNGGDIEKESSLNNTIIFIQSGENGGFAAGNNIGIKYALKKDDFEYIWLLNNDTVIEKDTLSKFVKSFEERKQKEKLGILGSIQYYYHKQDQIQAAAGGFNKWKGAFWNYQTLDFTQKDIAYIYGAAMFINKEVFKYIGLLNETYFMYYEEIDMAERLKIMKYTQDVDKNIKVYHKHGGTTTMQDSDFRTYYLLKNKIKFYKLYFRYLLPNAIIFIIKDFLRMQLILLIKSKKLMKFSTLYNSIIKGLFE